MASSNFQSSAASNPSSPSPPGHRPSVNSAGSSDSGYHSPRRHHFRESSNHQEVKETRNAHSEYSQDDGSSQLRINQYLIRQEIGRGSFGAVHLATDQYEREYAVKEFSKSRLRRRAKSNLLRRPRTGRPAGSPGGFKSPMGLDTTLAESGQSPAGNLTEENAFDLIREEIAVMKKLHHPNLVSLVEVLDDPEEDSLFMVLEMCKKGVIMKIEIEQDVDPYTEEECRTWFRDLILGIEYLHAQGIVHRDIKPDNCLLTDDDILKIVDFGVSEIFEKASEMRIAKSAGSPAFMAPELCRVKHGEVSGKPADIWSMGVTLYCLRFGRVPFRKDAMLDLYSAITNDDVSLPADCSPELADLVSRILEKNPEKRIPMEELREHPWVTSNGTDPLLPASENCAEIVGPPTDSEMNAAITSNIGRVIAIMKAVNRFKTLIARKRPDLVHSILGHASKIVKPPKAMYSPASRAKDATKPMSIPDEEMQRAKQEFAAKGDHQGAELLDQLDRLPGTIRTAVVSTSQPIDAKGSKSPDQSDSPPSPDSPRTLRQVHTVPEARQKPEPGKGHAHNPLEDHRFLSIGPGPHPDDFDGTSEIDFGSANYDPPGFVVSESPPPVGDNIFEHAYDKEVDNIYQEKGRSTTLYLTRRVEKKMRSKLSSLMGEDSSEQEPKSGSSAMSGFSSIVGKAINAGKDDQGSKPAVDEGSKK